MNDLENIRVSIGTASVLGLTRIRQKVTPTTAYLLMDAPEGCQASCQFCPQSQYATRTSTDKLSRIHWPRYPLSEVIQGFETNPQAFRRICIQAVNSPNMFADLDSILTRISPLKSIPISLSIPPLNASQLQLFKSKGVDRVGIPIDAATSSLFQLIKGKTGIYQWENHWNALTDARDVFGPFQVSTHLIIGLGETEEEAIRFLNLAFSKQITVGLFAFTPIKGTPLENRKPPEESSYRRIQIARYLLAKYYHQNKSLLLSLDKFFSFTNSTLTQIHLPCEELNKFTLSGVPFQTSGCPSCNRPYYNERPGGIIYNHPSKLSTEQSQKIWSFIIHDLCNHKL